MPPLSNGLSIPDYRLDAHALAFKSPRAPAVQPPTVSGSMTYSYRKALVSNGAALFVIDRVAAAPGNILVSFDRGATWGASLAGGLPVCIEPVWHANPAQPGCDLVAGRDTSLLVYTAAANAWAVAPGAPAGQYWGDVAVADQRTRGLVAYDPYQVTAQTVLAVGGLGVGAGVIARSTDSGATWAAVAGLPVVNTLTAVCKAADFWIAACITTAPDIGSILKSVNDGATWTAFHNVQVTPQAFAFDPTSGFLLGISNNKIYESGDGVTWNRVYTWNPAGYPLDSRNLTGIRFDQANTWIVTTGRGSVLLSTDRVHWRELVFPELTVNEADPRTVPLGAPFYENLGDVAPWRGNNLLFLAGAAAPKLYMGSGVLDYTS